MLSYNISSGYWISKDFYKPSNVSPNPLAQHISKVRNALEHKYVKVYWDIIPDRANGEIDDLALYVSEEELKEETFWLLKLIDVYKRQPPNLYFYHIPVWKFAQSLK